MSNRRSFAPLNPDTNELFSKWTNSLHDLLDDSEGRNVFREFLRSEFSEENLDFWLACVQYEQIDDCDERRKQAQSIWARFLAPTATRTNGVDDRSKELCSIEINSEINEALQLPSRYLFAGIQEQIYKLMKYDSYQRFIKSDMYKNRLSSGKETTRDQYAVIPAQSSQSTPEITPIDDKKAQETNEKKTLSLLPWTKAWMKWKKFTVKKPDSEATTTLVRSSNKAPFGRKNSQLHRLINRAECIIELPDDSVFRIPIEPDSALSWKYTTLEQLLRQPLAKRGYVWFRCTLRNAFTKERIPYSLPAARVVGERIKLYADRAIFVIIVEQESGLALRSRGSNTGARQSITRQRHSYAISAEKTIMLRSAIECLIHRLSYILSLLNNGYLYAIDGQRRTVSVDERVSQVDNRCLLFTPTKYDAIEDVPLYGLNFGGYDHFEGFLEDENLNLIEHFPNDGAKNSRASNTFEITRTSGVVDKSAPRSTVQNPTIFGRLKSTLMLDKFPVDGVDSHCGVPGIYDNCSDDDDDEMSSLPETFRRSHHLRSLRPQINSPDSSNPSVKTEPGTPEMDRFNSTSSEGVQVNSSGNKDDDPNEEEIIKALSSPRNRKPINLG